MPKLPFMVQAKSSNVGQIGHDAQGMHVIFKGGARYLYEGVPAEVYHEALAAESLGKFIAQRIKGQYRFVKFDAASNAA